MKNEEHDDLWDLLGKAKPVRASAFFSRNVLRAIREERSECAPSILGWLTKRWSLVAAGACAVAIAVVSIPREDHQELVMLLAQEISSSPDYHVISNLDELLDAEANSVWLDSPAY